PRSDSHLLVDRPPLRRWLGVVTIVVAIPASSPAADSIRVALVEAVRTAEIRGTDVEVTPIDVGCPSCPGASWRTDVVRATVCIAGIDVDGRSAAAFRLTSDRPLRFNGREYSSPLELVKNGGGIAIVNDLPMDEYLVGVLRAETGDRWPAEAL